MSCIVLPRTLRNYNPIYGGIFLNDPYGIGAIQPYGSEALESANAWLKRYNKYFTFKGDRKMAIKTVFKLRRLKSTYSLRKFIPKTVQGTRKCGKQGHKRNSKVCMGAMDIQVEETSDMEYDSD